MDRIDYGPSDGAGEASLPRSREAPQYRPYELTGKEFYSPSGNGYEVRIREHMRKMREESDSPPQDQNS